MLDEACSRDLYFPSGAGPETCNNDGSSQLLTWQQSDGGIWRVGIQAGDVALQQSKPVKYK